MDNSSKYLLKWANMVLKPKNISISDVKTDFKNGSALIAFIEQLTGKKSDKKLAPAKNELFCLNNIQIGIEMIEDSKLVKNLCVDARNFYSGQDYDEKLIFGFLFDIMLRHSVAGIHTAVEQLEDENGLKHESEKAEKDALLQWCNLVIGKFALQVKDFTDSWLNGLAYSALVASCDESNVDMEELKGNAMEVLKLPRPEQLISYKKAMQRNLFLIEDIFGVSQLLDDEFIDNPSDKANIMYISQIFKEYNSAKQNSSREQAMRKSALLLIVRREQHLEALRARVNDLCNAVAAKIDADSAFCSKFANEKYCAEADELTRLLGEIRQYDFSASEKLVMELEEAVSALECYERGYDKVSRIMQEIPVTKFRMQHLDNMHILKRLETEVQYHLKELQSVSDTELQAYWRREFDVISEGALTVTSDKFPEISSTFGLEASALKDLDLLDFDALCDLLDASMEERTGRRWVKKVFDGLSADKKLLSKDDMLRAGLSDKEAVFLLGKMAAESEGFCYETFCEEYDDTIE